MLEIKNLTKIYDHKKNTGIFDIDIDIKEKDIIAFIGQNGSGKTTTIKSIFNELKLESGEITINSDNLFENSNLRKVAFFPDSNSVPLKMSVFKYVNYIASVNEIKKDEVRNRIEKIFQLLNLNELKNQTLKQLSAGQKKRAIFAGVLITNPKYVIFDEPTANLDIESKREFLDIILELNKLNIGIMITSHIMDELQPIANKIIVINDGRIKYSSSFDNKNENILNIYNTVVKTENKKISLEGIIYND